MVESGTNLLVVNVQGKGCTSIWIGPHRSRFMCNSKIAIRDAIRNHRLSGDSVVPASRRLADQLGVSRGRGRRGLPAADRRGLSRQSHRRVHEGREGPRDPEDEKPSEAPRPLPGAAIDFRYGRPDISQFPRAAWLKTLRSVLPNAPTERLNYADGRGAPELRAALAAYLNRVRGTWADPDRVIACNGFAQAVTVMLPVLAAQGITRLAVEDPSDPDTRREAEFMPA